MTQISNLAFVQNFTVLADLSSQQEATTIKRPFRSYLFYTESTYRIKENTT